MSIAKALGLTNEQFLKIAEDNRNESDPEGKIVRNEQKTVSGSFKDCKGFCKNGYLRS